MFENADVIEETEFSPPCGDCIRMTTPKYPVMELSSPYGDSIFDEPDVAFYPEFSSLYGDCTGIDEQLVRDMGLSPPYGDGIESYACAEAEFTFSPPYEDGMLREGKSRSALLFCPLTGMI